MPQHHKIQLEEREMPRYWYNVLADMPHPPQPPLHPQTRQPLRPQDLLPLFPEGLLAQEMSSERHIEIPDEVQDLYRLYRPTPLYRAHRLEAALATPARIYYKYEGVSPSGSHKPNTALAQAYYNKQAGITKLTTETGAGQWGTALALAAQLLGLECEVYMVGLSYHQKPYRKTLMNSYGARVIPSPSEHTEAGRAALQQDPNHPGSLGLAISEAVEVAMQREDTHYALGSVLNHVLMHQTIIGEEALLQLGKTDDQPDAVIAPFGGGSNFAGIALPFVRHNLQHGTNIRCIAVEPASCPKLTRGKLSYDYGDSVGLTPLIPMYTLGHNFVPPRIHAGGLRYHGAGAIISQLLEEGLVEAEAYQQLACFDAAIQFARTEGILPAPEAAHAVAATVKQAQEAKAAGDRRCILMNLCGHGYFDLSAYEAYFKGELQDHTLEQSEIERNLAELGPLQPESP
jgi:tryptophan synthase beta chain